MMMMMIIIITIIIIIWVEATETDALRKSSRISRKERIRNATIRQ